MSAYVDQEISECLNLAMKALVNLEKDMQKVRSIDIEGEREAAHDVQTCGMFLTSHGEVVALIRMEDVWAEADIPDHEEREVLNKVLSVAVNPGHYKVEDGNIVKKF